MINTDGDDTGCGLAFARIIWATPRNTVSFAIDATRACVNRLCANQTFRDGRNISSPTKAGLSGGLEILIRVRASRS